MNTKATDWRYVMNAGGWCMSLITQGARPPTYRNFVLTRVTATDLYTVRRPEMRLGGPGWYMVEIGRAEDDVTVICGPSKRLADAKQAGLNYAKTQEG